MKFVYQKTINAEVMKCPNFETRKPQKGYDDDSHHREYGHKKKKRESFLEDLFDF